MMSLSRFAIASAVFSVANAKLDVPTRSMEYIVSVWVEQPESGWDDDGWSNNGSLAVKDGERWVKGQYLHMAMDARAGATARSHFGPADDYFFDTKITCQTDTCVVANDQPWCDADPDCSYDKCTGGPFDEFAHDQFDRLQSYILSLKPAGLHPCPEFLLRDFDLPSNQECDLHYTTHDDYSTAAYALPGSSSLLGAEVTRKDGAYDTREIYTQWDMRDPHIDPQRFKEFPCDPSAVAPKLRGSPVRSAWRRAELPGFPSHHAPWFLPEPKN